MPKTVFTQEEIDSFVKKPAEDYEKEKNRHCYYKECNELAESIKVHADGAYPKKLLWERRPNEPLEVQEYRRSIWKPKTKPTFSKVFSSLQKIRRSTDWAIKYPEDDFSRIADEETLEKYCEEHYPFFTSVTNWMFSIGLRKQLIDPNAVLVVEPEEWDIEETGYLKPFVEVYDSCHVIAFYPEDYAVVDNVEGCYYMTEKGKKVKGRSIKIITTQAFLQYDQVDEKGNFKLLLPIRTHELGILPAVQFKGIIIDQQEGKFLYESRVSGMIPELDEAAREYSDLQASKVLHMYPERWEFTQNECAVCKGAKVRPNPDWTVDCGCSETVNCSACNGTGYVVAGPYSKIMVRPVSGTEIAGQTSIPTPPAGFIEKDVEIIKLMDQSVHDHIYNALSAINFEFLAQVPLAQSGIAKSTDRDEANNTAHSIAEDTVALMDSIYKITAYYRYKGQYPFDEIDTMLPAINVPEKYDLLSAAHISEEIKEIKDSINPIIRNALEIDYAGKRFNTEPEVQDRLMLVLKLDPLAGMSQDEKMSMLSNKGITQESYVISSNINSFVQRAIDEDKDFPDKELKEQKAVMLKYAQEQINSNSVEGQVLGDPEINDFGAPQPNPNQANGQANGQTQQNPAPVNGNV